MSVNGAMENRPVGGGHDLSRTSDRSTGTGNQDGPDAERSASGRPQRAMAVLGRGRSVVVVGRNLDLDAWLQVLQEALTKGRRAKSYGLSLEAFLRMSRDSAE